MSVACNNRSNNAVHVFATPLAWAAIASASPSFAAGPSFVPPCISAELVAPGGAPQDLFGSSVAISAGSAIVGAPLLNMDGPGRAYIFIDGDGAWTPQAELQASDAADGDRFGAAVSIDADTAVIGAPRNGGVAASAYVFIRGDGAWLEEATLKPADVTGKKFGSAVALRHDTVVVGAPTDAGIGAAYVFVRTGDAWSQQAKLVPSDGELFDAFGTSVAIDGDTIVVGAPLDDDHGDSSGAVYVFSRDGTTWSERVKLKGTSHDQRFGSAVALDATTLVVGAPSQAFHGVGAAQVLVGEGATWSPQATLLPLGGGFSQFGTSVAIEGNTAVIGAWHDDSAGYLAGAVYVFARTGPAWIQQVKLIGAEEIGQLGNSVAISGDTAIAGAWVDNNVNGGDAGTAFVVGLAGVDCNDNGVNDACDIASGASADVNSNNVPDECECLGDVSGDGIVNGDDLGVTLAAWGATGSTRGGRSADINADGVVDGADLGFVLALWGPCP